MRCDPSLNPDQLNTDAEKFPCDGRIQFQHMFYEPKDEDDGKLLSCSLDENGDMNPEYFAAPINLKVNPREDNIVTVGPLGIDDDEENALRSNSSSDRKHEARRHSRPRSWSLPQVQVRTSLTESRACAWGHRA